MNIRALSSIAIALGLLSASTQANFHVMQIEQVIGGVNGSNTAQAIQLRQRVGGQNVIQQASLWAADAAGNNRVLLLDITSPAASGAAGSSILFTTAAFNATMVANGNAGFTGDFTLTTAIPASYLAAGVLTFEGDGGAVWWSLAWGGASFTGTNTGVGGTNDADGFFGDNLTHPAPFGTALPTAGAQSVLFDGAFGDLSTNNAADYIIDTTVVVTRNNGSSFAVVPEPGSAALIGSFALGAFAFLRRRRS